MSIRNCTLWKVSYPKILVNDTCFFGQLLRLVYDLPPKATEPLLLLLLRPLRLLEMSSKLMGGSSIYEDLLPSIEHVRVAAVAVSAVDDESRDDCSPDGDSTCRVRLLICCQHDESN